MAKKQKKTFTEQEVAAYRDRMQRSHRQDLALISMQQYSCGVEAGRRAVIEALIECLDLDNRFIRHER